MEVSKRNLFKHKKCPLARISSHLSKWLFFSFDNPMTVKASLIKILTIFLFTLVSRHTRKALVHHLIKLLSTNLVPDVFFPHKRELEVYIERILNLRIYWSQTLQTNSSQFPGLKTFCLFQLSQFWREFSGDQCSFLNWKLLCCFCFAFWSGFEDCLSICVEYLKA